MFNTKAYHFDNLTLPCRLAPDNASSGGVAAGERTSDRHAHGPLSHAVVSLPALEEFLQRKPSQQQILDWRNAILKQLFVMYPLSPLKRAVEFYVKSNATNTRELINDAWESKRGRSYSTVNNSVNRLFHCGRVSRDDFEIIVSSIFASARDDTKQFLRELNKSGSMTEAVRAFLQKHPDRALIIEGLKSSDPERRRDALDIFPGTTDVELAAALSLLGESTIGESTPGIIHKASRLLASQQQLAEYFSQLKEKLGLGETPSIGHFIIMQVSDIRKCRWKGTTASDKTQLDDVLRALDCGPAPVASFSVLYELLKLKEPKVAEEIKRGIINGLAQLTECFDLSSSSDARDIFVKYCFLGAVPDSGRQVAVKVRDLLGTMDVYGISKITAPQRAAAAEAPSKPRGGRLLVDAKGVYRGIEFLDGSPATPVPSLNLSDATDTDGPSMVMTTSSLAHTLTHLESSVVESILHQWQQMCSDSAPAYLATVFRAIRSKEPTWPELSQYRGGLDKLLSSPNPLPPEVFLRVVADLGLPLNYARLARYCESVATMLARKGHTPLTRVVETHLTYRRLLATTLATTHQGARGISDPESDEIEGILKRLSSCGLLSAQDMERVITMTPSSRSEKCGDSADFLRAVNSEAETDPEGCVLRTLARVLKSDPVRAYKLKELAAMLRPNSVSTASRNGSGQRSLDLSATELALNYFPFLGVTADELERAVYSNNPTECFIADLTAGHRGTLPCIRELLPWIQDPLKDLEALLEGNGSDRALGDDVCKVKRGPKTRGDEHVTYDKSKERDYVLGVAFLSTDAKRTLGLIKDLLREGFKLKSSLVGGGGDFSRDKRNPHEAKIATFEDLFFSLINLEPARRTPKMISLYFFKP